MPLVHPRPQGLFLDDFQNGREGPGNEVALSRDIPRRGVLAIMPKIPEISVGMQMERSVSGFLLEYLESPLEMVRLFLSEYSDRTVLLRRSIFDKPVFTLIREFGKGIKK